MKMKKQLICSLLTVLCSIEFTGCSHSQGPNMTNELHFDLEGITDLTISYDEEPIMFYESEDDELVIKEYMTENKKSYYAHVKQSNDTIHISEGGKPILKSSFSRRVEVFLPSSYNEALTITTTDGEINLANVYLKNSKLRVDSTKGKVNIDHALASNMHLTTTSGKLNLGTIDSENLRLDTTSGNVICNQLIGNVTYTSTSGNAIIKSAKGCGSYKANNSGKLDVTYEKVTGDLYLFNKNDNINLTLPKDLEFEFEATTKNGSVRTSFQERMSIDGRTTRGIVGKNPTVTVTTETKNGDIDVN